MSTQAESESVFATGSRRALALAATALLMASYLSVLNHITDVAGGTERLILFVAGSLLAATLLARFLPALLALVLTAGLSAVGLWVYIQAIPNGELFFQ
ncbi:MAG TPA: transglutaminase, partial [Halococcus sp.]|nr:transglutaminase [Halococcus sp.]